MQGQFDAHSVGNLTTGIRNPITGKIALGTTAGVILQYDVEADILDARQLSDLMGNSINTLAYSPKGIFIASAHRQGYIGVWHAASGKGVLVGQADKMNCQALVWSRGGAFLVVQCVGKQELVVYPASEYTLGIALESGQVLQLGTIEPIFKWRGGKGNLVVGDFSPDDMHFVFTGGDNFVQVINTTSWEIEYKVKVPTHPMIMHWIANDRLLVSGPLEKGAKGGEDLLLLLDIPSGKVLFSQTCTPILIMRPCEQEELVFLLQDFGDNPRLGFRVLNLKTLQIVGEVTPNISNICDIVLLPDLRKVCVITRTSVIVGAWDGKDGSNYEQRFSLQDFNPAASPTGQSVSKISPLAAKESEERSVLFGFRKMDIKSIVAIGADGSRRLVIPGLDLEVVKKWYAR